MKTNDTPGKAGRPGEHFDREFRAANGKAEPRPPAAASKINLTDRGPRW